MIRRAVRSDLGRVMDMLRDFHTAAGLDDGANGFAVPFSPAHLERMFLQHILNRRALCLLHVVDDVPHGVLMATATEHPFGPVMTARETLWWIDPAHRGRAAQRMLDAYEDWARHQGCAFAGMAGLGSDPAVGRLYERRGYVAVERNYMKALR